MMAYSYNIDVLAALSKLALILIPAILTIIANQYFLKRKEEREEHKKMFDSLGDKLSKLEETLSLQTAKYAGMMEKMQHTTEQLSLLINDVRTHERLINEISGKLRAAKH